MKGCIKAGTVRFIGHTESCKDNELEVTFLTGQLGQITSEMVENGTLTSADLSEDLLGSFLTSESDVDWSQLTSIPTDLADGDDDGATLVTDLANALSDPEGTDATPGEAGDPVSWYRIKGMPEGFADGEDDVDGGIASDLDCDGCLSADDLGAGSVGQSELQSGAVSTDKQGANAAASFTSSVTMTLDSAMLSEEDSSTQAILRPDGTGTAPHSVMLTGQFQAECDCPPGELITVEWQIVKGDTPVGPAYTDTLAVTRPSLVGSVSWLDQAAAEGSETTYKLRVRTSSMSLAGPAAVTVRDIMLHAVDLGRS